ncbi:peroxiredoxin [Acidiphilium sp.]|uniref:peroxiredoxin n=1 Tax=Acidiphilium sp. TaxID=527 RepID=UPI003CFD6274
MTITALPEPINPPHLHDPAPEFRARTTMGMRTLSDYRGRWLLFFSHPADFTPVCASEFVAFARAADRFAALDCALLALSVDSLYSHLAWLRSIRAQFGVEITFPIIEDPSMAIARSFGMITSNAADTALVRAVFVIDPIGIVRSILWYPMTTGRNIEELLRLVAALRTSDAHHVSTPANWAPGDDVIVPPPQSSEGLYEPIGPGEDWYYHTAPIRAEPAAATVVAKVKRA